MSQLIDASISIHEAMQHIKNGKYVMPAFQRQYVWSMEQIEKLWDSILLDYPIATFLFWHVDDDNVTWDTYFCNFLQQVTFDSRKQADSTNYELSRINVKDTDTAVLDGQQRLTSLFLSLYGDAGIRQKYARKSGGARIVSKLLVELNRHKLNVDEDEYNSKKFDIKFSEKVGKLSPTQFEVKRILDAKFQDANTRNQAIDAAIAGVPQDSREYAQGILSKLCEKIYDEKLIRYTEIYDMKQDDALEMFVRFNSGGKALRKSEITMSILEAYWPNAKTEFGQLLSGAFEKFDTDFIIRAGLMLYGDVVKSTINKQIADELKNNWHDFKKALNNLGTLLQSYGVDVSHFSGSWNVLLPIIYVIYFNPDYMNCKDGIRAYLLRAVLFTYFQSGTTSKLQQMKSNINSFDREITVEMLDQMNELRLTDGRIEDILNAEKGSRIAGEALYYLSVGWLNKAYKYEQDHLHPYDRFDNAKPASVTMDEWNQWRADRNRLPNLHLLEGRSNGSKGSMRLVDYFNSMNEAQQKLFCEEALIPGSCSLEFEDFGTFFKARKKLLFSRLREMLS